MHIRPRLDYLGPHSRSVPSLSPSSSPPFLIDIYLQAFSINYNDQIPLSRTASMEPNLKQLHKHRSNWNIESEHLVYILIESQSVFCCTEHWGFRLLHLKVVFLSHSQIFNFFPLSVRIVWHSYSHHDSPVITAIISASLTAQLVKNPQGTLVQFLGWKDMLEEE